MVRDNSSNSNFGELAGFDHLFVIKSRFAPRLLRALPGENKAVNQNRSYTPEEQLLFGVLLTDSFKLL
jgi:hypothetical protein